MKHSLIARLVMPVIVAVTLATPALAYGDVATGTVLPQGPGSGGSLVPGDGLAATTPAPVIVVTSYGTSADRITPGTAFDLELTLYNATSRRADNVVVVLGSAGGSGEAGAAIAGGLTVLETGNAKYVGTLRGQREVSVTFRVIASPGTTPGAMNVPVAVSFEHGGTRQDVGYTVGLLVEREPALSLVTAETPDSAVVGESFPVSFEVANASGFALSGVTLSVEASGGVVADGTVFLGTMDAATTEIIDATVTAEKAGDLEVTVVLSYRDDFGKQQAFRQTRTVTVTDQPAVEEPAPGDAGEEPQDGNWFTRFFKALFGLGD